MFELMKKKRKLEIVFKSYDKQITKAKAAKKSEDEIQGLIDEMFMETDEVKEEIQTIIQRKWTQTAEELFLPIPPYNDEDAWNHSQLSGRYIMTNSGITRLRTVIREEQTARRKAVLEWASPLIGILGALTGLLAVVLR